MMSLSATAALCQLGIFFKLLADTIPYLRLAWTRVCWGRPGEN